MLKVLVISDLHYDKRVFRDIDESRAWQWLLDIVDYHGPDLLMGLGDWGEAVNVREFYELLRRVRVWGIYGNHENLGVLESVYNVLTKRPEPVLMGDGEVRVFGGVRFGAINGIVALRRRMKNGVPRKTPDEYVRIARRLRGRVDVLLMHDSPKLPLPEYEFMTIDDRVRAVARAVEEARPKLVFCGHIHTWKPYTIYRFSYGGLYVRVDSSQRWKAYAILDIDSNAITVWVDRRVALKLPIPYRLRASTELGGG